MKKSMKLVLSAALLGLALAGCGKASLTVDDHHLTPNGMAATIKGRSNQKQVHYTINGGAQQSKTTNNGGYSITLPAKSYQQTVKLTTAGQHQTVTVAKTGKLISYQKFQSAYNQALAFTKLSAADQKTATQLSSQAAALKQEQANITAKVAAAKAKLKAGDTSASATLQTEAAKATQLKASAAKLQQTQATLAPKMKQAQQQVKSQTLPTTAKSGISNLSTTSGNTLRANVQNGQVIGLTLMVPTSALKNKADAKTFITSFSLLATSVGANAKHVLKAFSDKANKKNTSQTTTSTIHSNGLSFDLGYSTSTLYIYVTK